MRLTDGWCGDADAAQVGRVEEGAECESKAVDLLRNLPTLTFGHELWVVTGRMRLEVQTAEMLPPGCVGSALLTQSGAPYRIQGSRVDLLLFTWKRGL